MSLLRHSLFSVVAALVAALAVLFVSTASLACDAAVDPGMTSMSMGSHDGPCEHKAPKMACQKACLVLCQGLVPQSDDAGLARLCVAVRYPSATAPLRDFSRETDDPPPRA